VDYANEWLRSSLNVDELICAITSEDGVLSEPVVARTVVEVSGDLGIPLVVGSSMPVRDVEWWSNSRRSPTYANRGVNGIDGVVSTVFGVCAGSKGIGFVGDLTLLHDVSALVDGLGEQGGSCVLVVSDNQGGGIFSFLPQATALDEESFEQLFATPRTLPASLFAAFPLAFAAGLVSFASPCVLPLLPGYVAFLGGSTARVEGRTAEVAR
jgi:2-succinyl-5-enolpyruvyl-6-hydroxy-3-cyclohexene-1-carboxylate synthase